MKRAYFPQIKKDLKVFLNSEEAKITKKDALRLGVGILLVLGAASALFPKEAMAQHTNYVDNTLTTGRHISHTSHASHGSHGSHGSHASHASHASHGSHGQW